jgi:FKBP-type peptidyl-prolyl cis-trans isomerase SlyD
VTPVPAARDTVVSLRIEMYDAHGELLDAPADPVTYLHGGYGGLLEALEAALEGKVAGESVQVQVEPEDAFGEYDAGLLRVEPADRYGKGVAVGMEVEEDSQIYTVTDVAAGKVVLDGNHPLAGMALRFALEIVAVRPARPEEISRGVSLP